MKWMEVLKRLHRSQQGAEGAEKLLIIAAIVLPLLGFLILARDYIAGWTQEKVIEVKSDSGTGLPSGF